MANTQTIEQTLGQAITDLQHCARLIRAESPELAQQYDDRADDLEALLWRHSHARTMNDADGLVIAGTRACQKLEDFSLYLAVASMYRATH